MGGDRWLRWEGCCNVRDLGGLPVRDGVVAPGALVRADSLNHLTDAGWAALVDHGVRTVIDLRNDDERREDMAPRPEILETITVPLDGVHDTEFWAEWMSGPQFGTPLYYLPHLRRFPDRTAAVVSAVARARPGGVVFHCNAGQDRAGQIAMVLLALLGATAETIAGDYALSAEARPALAAARGIEDDRDARARVLAEYGTTIPQVLADTLAGIDLRPALTDAGLADADLTALQARALAR